MNESINPTMYAPIYKLIYVSINPLIILLFYPSISATELGAYTASEVYFKFFISH